MFFLAFDCVKKGGLIGPPPYERGLKDDASIKTQTKHKHLGLIPVGIEHAGLEAPIPHYPLPLSLKYP